MMLPRVLIIDDQCGWDSAYRKTIAKRAGLLISGSHEESLKLVAEVTVCSGQTKIDGSVINDYDVIRKAVAGTTGNGSEWSLVLLDVQFDSGKIGDNGLPSMLPGDESFGERVRPQLLSDFPKLPLVMLTGKHQSELQDEEYPYLTKNPLTPYDFKIKLLQYGLLTSEQQRYLLGLDSRVIAISPITFNVFYQAYSIAENKAPILILGESGVGKEVLAKYIHHSSERKGLLVPINVAAIPSELVESELFGHVKGAFTGAIAEKEGAFERADGGTLFLDEIGDMPLKAQVKLLRALQENEIQRVGGKSTIKVNVRILSATSQNVSELLEKQKLRIDLLGRIGGTVLTVPPLRDRKEDLIPLAEKFIIDSSSQSNKTGIILSADTKAFLYRHPFFGNVRELEHVMKRLVSTVGNNRVISVNEIEDALASSISSFMNTKDVIKPEASVQLSPQRPNMGSSTINSLEELLQLIRLFKVAKDSPDLEGAKKKVDDAVQHLSKVLAGACLEACRDKRTKIINLQAAMQFFTGNNLCITSDPKRAINPLLGRLQSDKRKVTQEDMEVLVDIWRGRNGDRNT
jgi:DNA-binding NtrC family response regulator